MKYSYSQYLEEIWSSIMQIHQMDSNTIRKDILLEYGLHYCNYFKFTIQGFMYKISRDQLSDEKHLCIIAKDGRKINKSLQTVLTDIINIINERKSMDTTWYENFIKAVKDMRSAQKEYFKTRNYIILENAKKLEREVDKLLEENNDL